MSTFCVCFGSSILCPNCEITRLKKEIKKLRQELDMYTHIMSEELDLKYWQIADINKTFTRSKIPLKFEYKHNLSKCNFITITFDPAKFGIQPLHEERKNYILSKLFSMIKSCVIMELYGCFEYTKAGFIHAHLIASTNYRESEIKQILKVYFTDNMRNTKAVDVGPAKHPQAEEYINKESDDYFRYLNPQFNQNNY